MPSDLLAFLKSLHPDIKRKIKAGLKYIMLKPSSGKSLKDELEGLRSYRVGRYRIIYRDVTSILEIIEIGEREKVYEDTLKKLAQEKNDLH
ncbi:MAG: hypothetical protein EPN94_03855 [Nitrospirae bacterium]|nr:MAG: hypothetical protein EPN94_03855 [Nitrospirota bacterium]